jgi:hypothetical protein
MCEKQQSTKTAKNKDEKDSDQTNHCLFYYEGGKQQITPLETIIIESQS